MLDYWSETVAVLMIYICVYMLAQNAILVADDIK